MNRCAIERPLRLLCLLVLAYALYGALATGYVLSLVSPRAVPLLRMAWVTIGVMALVEFRSFVRPVSNVQPLWRYAAWLLLIVVAVAIKPTGPSAQMAQHKGLGAATTRSRPAPVAASAAMSSLSTDAGRPAEPESLTLTDTTFYPILDRMYNEPQRFEGRFVTMTGFVVPDTTLGPDGFFLARMMVTCCAADAMPVGYFCMAGDAVKARHDQWLTVTARVLVRRVKLPWLDTASTMPVLRVLRRRTTSPPTQQYLYPMSR